MKRIVLALVVAAAAAVAAPSIALAANAVVLRDADVFRRATGDTVVNEVERNQLVTVTECRQRRCLVEIPGRDGWVRRDRLEPYDEDSGESGGSITFDFGGVGVTIGEGGTDVTVGGGGGSSGPSSGPRVCFFEHAGYGGRSFCVRRGESLSSVGYAWNDRISSIRVYGGARVDACEHDGFAGSCATYDSNVANLGGYNDFYSSVTVY